ncbi:MAG: ComEA family DNA-binding protein [Candidatus Cyclobacteriaceae bacterium M3_2C_046]
MMRCLFFIFLAIAVSWSKCFSQTHPAMDDHQVIEQIIEEYFSSPSESDNYEEVFEAFFYNYENPLNLNEANMEDLHSLYLLSDQQIQTFLTYRDEFGELLSIYELIYLEGFDPKLIQQLIPFVVVSPGKVKRRSILTTALEDKNNFLLIRSASILENKQGYTDLPDSVSQYLGSADQLYFRFRANQRNNFSLGITTEKDPGESLKRHALKKNYGPDFYSGHVFLYNRGPFTKIALGDYRLQFGQSLVLGNGFSLGKGGEAVQSIRQNATGLQPYSSATEFGFFRGIATSLGKKQLATTVFYSNKNNDASIVEDQNLAGSIKKTGYHRTHNEYLDKKSLNEQNAGTNIKYRSKNYRFQLGYTLLTTWFNKQVVPGKNYYSQFKFSGKNLWNSSIDYRYNWKNIYLLGETAVSGEKGWATMNGLLAHLSSEFQSALLFRHYNRRYSSFYSSAFSESQNQNETGTYLGFKYKPSSRLSMNFYVDTFKFPWLKYNVAAPSTGQEVLYRFNYSFASASLVYLQIKHEQKQKNLKSTATDTPGDIQKNSLLINYDYKTGKIISLKSRLQGSSFRSADKQVSGLALVQDLNFNFETIKFYTRLALFDAKDFENRQYVYEHDLRYTFSFPFYYGQGTRIYILSQVNLSPKITFWIKYARTSYYDREVIGSGLEQIEGSRKTELKMQVKYHL